MSDRFAYARTYERLYRLGYHAKRDYSHAKNICERVASGGIAATSALDVGCSTGWAVRRLGELGLRASGVDVASTAVKKGRAKGLDLHEGSATKLPFDDGAFELVLSTDCFEHLHPEDVAAAVSESVRVSSHWLAFKINPRRDHNRWWRFVAGSPLHLTMQPMEWWVEQFEAEGTHLVQLDRNEEEIILSLDPSDVGTLTGIVQPVDEAAPVG